MTTKYDAEADLKIRSQHLASFMYILGIDEEDFLKTLPSSIKILCFLQTVICSSIWFVWFFMVRRRFKI